MGLKIIDRVKKSKEETITAPQAENTSAETAEQVKVPETVVCKSCGKTLDKEEVVANKYVCYECGYSNDRDENAVLNLLALAK